MREADLKRGSTRQAPANRRRAHFAHDGAGACLTHRPRLLALIGG